MKTISKILLAIFGAPLVLLLLIAAAARRIFAGSYYNQADTILLYSQVTWDEVWQRPQQYAWRAAEICPVVYCCPVQLHNLLFLRGKWRPVRSITDGNRRLLVLSPLIFSGHFKSRFIHEINCQIVAWHIQLALAATMRVHVLANTPYALRVVQKCFFLDNRRQSRLARLVYDVIDDFTIFDWSPAFGKSFDKTLLSMSDSVIAGTQELADARPNAVFVPCGVDYELFSEKQPSPDDLKVLPRPFIGYFGTISERIDLDLIASLADNFPDGSIVMVGPVHLPVHSLPQRSNIHYRGLQRHAVLPAYAQAFDVALIPFRITPATVKLNPVKTLEYLAAGVPVVATPLPDLQRFYSRVIHIADTHEAYVAEVKKILAKPDHAKIQSGMEIARTASWERMVEIINDALLPDCTQVSADTIAEPAQL